MSNLPNPEDFFKSKIIAGKRYTIQALPVWDAYDGCALLTELVLPVMGEWLDASRVSEETMMFEKQNTFREIMTIAAQNINKPEMKTLVNRMLQGVSCEGESISVEEHFKGKIHHMMELIVYAFEVNFKDFFMESDITQSLMGGVSNLMGGLQE